MSFIALTCILVAIDGDTLRCGEERIRLLGIDAPELPGHCQEERECVPGDPFASKKALESAVRGPAMIERQGQDTYGRTLARVRVGGGDLSCKQIKNGHALYKPAWDQFQLVGTGCGLQSQAAPPSKTTRLDRRRTSSDPTPRVSYAWSYRNCAEARRAGATPLRRGSPGYGVHMDGDGDGVACEPPRR